MKIITVILISLVAFFMFCNFTSFAQEPTAEPTDAPVTEPVVDQPTPTDSQDLVTKITALIATAAGLLSSVIINIIKGIPGLSEGNKSKLSGATLEVMSVIVGVVTGYAVGLVAQGLGLIGDNSLRLMVISLAAPIVSEVRYRLGQLATNEVHTM